MQNAALITSHRLSNVSNCSFQKYWESKFFYIKNTVVTAVSAVTIVRKITQPLHKKIIQPLFFSFTLSVFWESAIWHIWQLMWCSQGSVLRFSWCFFFLSLKSSAKFCYFQRVLTKLLICTLCWHKKQTNKKHYLPKCDREPLTQNAYNISLYPLVKVIHWHINTKEKRRINLQLSVGPFKAILLLSGLVSHKIKFEICKRVLCPPSTMFESDVAFLVSKGCVVEGHIYRKFP